MYRYGVLKIPLGMELRFLSNLSTVWMFLFTTLDFDLSRKSPVYSTENIETVWATNHISVLMTDLLPLMKTKMAEYHSSITRIDVASITKNQSSKSRISRTEIQR